MVKPLRFIHALRVATISRAARESRSRECWAGSVGGEKARTGKLSRDEKNTRDEENRGPARPRKQPLDLSEERPALPFNYRMTNSPRGTVFANPGCSFV